MREITAIKFVNRNLSFIDLIYYDGVKLQVNLDENLLLVWYDYAENSEIWFSLKVPERILKEYLSNKTSLLDVFYQSRVSLFSREYDNFDEIQRLTIVNSLKEYELADDDAYLGFNFTTEKEYNLHLFKNFRKNINHPRKRIFNKKKVKATSQQYSNFNQIQVEWRIHVAA